MKNKQMVIICWLFVQYNHFISQENPNSRSNNISKKNLTKKESYESWYFKIVTTFIGSHWARLPAAVREMSSCLSPRPRERLTGDRESGGNRAWDLICLTVRISRMWPYSWPGSKWIHAHENCHPLQEEGTMYESQPFRLERFEMFLYFSLFSQNQL